MTIELEQEFFKAFNIMPRARRALKSFGFPSPEIDVVVEYPDITAEKLLEMICILGTTIRHFEIPPKLKLEQLKCHILKNCINEQEGIYTRIQQLFKKG